MLLALGPALGWQTGCYAQRAVERSAEQIGSAWDLEAQGPGVLVAGPGLTTLALGELALNSVRPPPEPRRQWFRGYPGPMRPLAEVALLCHAQRATNATAILALETGTLMPARHARWHYPECLELLAGRYRVQVHYYDRHVDDAASGLETATLESSQPSVVDWEAEAGGLYQLEAVLGPLEPALESEASFFRAPPRPGTPGTTAHEIDARSFEARIVRLGSAADLDPQRLEDRERWRAWEEALGD